jgi:hypothetical protein
MHIPQKFQDLFHDTVPVTIPDKDVERLSPYLSGWPVLHAFFMKGVSEIDLKRLIIIELMGERRESMIYRLAARLGRVQHERLWDRITSTVTLVPTNKRK